MNHNFLINTPLKKNPGLNWDPSLKTNLQKWFRSDTVTLSSGDLSTFINKGPTGAAGTVTGNIPREAAALNGWDAYRFDGSTPDRVFFDSNTIQYFFDGQPFSCFWVYKAETWGGAGSYMSILQLNAGTGFGWGVYYINPTGGLTGYPSLGVFRIGGGQRVMGPLTFSQYNQYHYVLVNYNGSGSNNEANYKIWIDGVQVTVAYPGGNQGGTSNNLLNQLRSADGHTPGGHWVEYGQASSQFDMTDRAGLFSYMKRRYNLGTGVES